MKKVELSERMQAVADFVTNGNRVCDVGCDHGYVSIYLVQEKIAPSVLAMDVNKGPLLRAKEHVQQYDMERYITLRLSDGLTAYEPGEADTLICAGMGGRLLQSILEKEAEKTADFKELILQPQSEIGAFRRFLRNEGYCILAENMILEDGKFYPMMKAVPGDKTVLCEGEGTQDLKITMEDMFGPLLLKQKHPVLLQFLHFEKEMKEGILKKLQEKEVSDKTEVRKKELEEELRMIAEAIGQFDK